MSFGFSVGDFLAVIELVTRLRKDFVNAPSQLRDISVELKTFSIVLQDTEVDLTENELDPGQIQALESTLSSARVALADLQRFIEKHKEVSNATGSKARGSVKRIWKRLNFDQEEVSRFRLQLSSIVSGLNALSLTEVKHNTRKIARYVDKQVYKEVLEWLSDDDFKYHKNYQSHLVRNRQAGTRRWLLESDEWNLWLKSPGQTLYGPGIPGSGKTFTTAMAIENIEGLSEKHDCVFAYVFCNYQQRRENMHEILLRSLLRMILEQTQQISDEVQQWPTRNKEVRIDEILEQLQVSIKACTRVYLVVDALDELDELHTFVSYLYDMQTAVGVNLYFTSRDIPRIRMLFNAAMIIPIKATENDVGMYLDHQMMSHFPNFVRNNQTLQDDIKKTIVAAAGEMFLLAELQVKQLMQSKTTRRLQHALKAITLGTSTYETAYEAAMERIQSQEKRACELAKDAISILAYAERPLLAPELVHALSVDFELDHNPGSELQTVGDLQSMPHSLGVYDPDLMPTIEDVLVASAGLIVHQPDSGIVQLVHKTTKEYLMSDRGRQKWFPRAQFTIAAICLIYLQAFEESDGASDWPFLDYAQKHYGHHIMAQQNLEKCEDYQLEQSSHGSSVERDASLLQAQQLMDQMGLARMAQELGRTGNVLVSACQNNQLNLARVLLSTYQYSQSTGWQEETYKKSRGVEKPSSAIGRGLTAAARNGHLEVVDLLLKNGASPAAPVEWGMSLLVLAPTEGLHSIVAYLLDHGYYTMDMMRYNLDGFNHESGVRSTMCHFEASSPICMAAYHGQPECVSILLRWIGINKNESFRDADQERIVESVTLSAMGRGHVSVLEVLPRLNEKNMASMLRNLKDPNLLYTSIRRADTGELAYNFGRRMKRSRQDAVAEFLMRNYTFDVSVRNANGANAMTLAAKADMPEISRRILDQNGDLLNSRDNSGLTPFSWAAKHSINTVRMLLSHKSVQPELLVSSEIDDILQNPTRYYKNSIALMIPYLEHGVNRIGRDGFTLLHELMEERHRERSKMSEIAEFLGRHKHGIFEDVSFFREDFVSRGSGKYGDVSFFREALEAVPVSSDDIRSSPCKCGIGTIFLAVQESGNGPGIVGSIP